MSLRPAWSEVFRPDRLQRVPALPLDRAREWAWGGSNGAGVTVAVVDSGVEADHPLVRGVDGWAAFSQDVAGGPVVRNDEPHADVVGHGTACAGIVRRLAPGVRLLSVRVLGERLSGRSPVFAEGLRWAIGSGARVVNLSLSTSRPEHRTAFYDLADEAAAAGVVLVCAVSNLPGPSIPSTFSSVVSVAAHERRDPYGYDANPRPPVDFGAPGIDVEVAWRGGTSLVTTGNSFAAPHLTAHVARLLAKHPDLTPYEVKAVLRACADNADVHPGVPAGRPALADRPAVPPVGR